MKSSERAVRWTSACSFSSHGTLRGLCCPRFAKYSRPANARVGRGGGRRRHAAGPAPAAAPAAGGVGAVMAGPRRARARCSPHAAARRGHLRPPDVGLLRAFRHARRRPRRAARAAQGRLSDPRATACSGSAPARRSGCSARSAARATWDRSSTACRPCTGAGSSCRTARSLYMLLRHREQASALRGADGRVLRPGLRGLLAACPPPRPGTPARTGRCRRCAGSWPRRASASGAPLAPALPFVARQSLRSHALPSFRYISDGRPDPVAGWDGSRGRSAGPTR